MVCLECIFLCLPSATEWGHGTAFSLLKRGRCERFSGLMCRLRSLKW